MTSQEYINAKYVITSACNSTGLAPEELVGVLSAIIAEAREQMCFGLTAELLATQEQIKKLTKEADANGNSTEAR